MILRFLLLLTLSLPVHADDIHRLNYEGFTIWVDCDKHGAVKFQYNAQRDTGSFKRKKSFYYDPDLPKSCQQSSTKSYQSIGQRYDRGHLVPANHLDYSEVAITQSNYMTNILPQASNMNRGAWLLTEKITECYRDIDELLIIGGVIWGDNSEDDFYVKSHGVKTPDAFWKVIIRNDRVIAWIVPNSSVATRKRLDDYLVTVTDIERLTGESIPVADYLKDDKPVSS
jgi:endonuclease G, mitochondrial